MNAERLLAHYERIADASDAIQRLRRLVLDLAVRGKLLPQDPANELLAKTYLREPSSKSLPSNWRVLNFEKYCDIQGGNQPPKSQFVDEPRDGYVQLFQIRDLGERPVPTYIPINSTNRFCKEGEILIGRYGASVGKVFWAQNGAYNVAMAKFIWPEDAFISTFAFLLLKSRYLQEPLESATRSAQAGFNKGDLAAINFPLPPLAEQHRIVAKVDELMALCDRLEAARAEREATRDRLAASTLARLNTPDPANFQADARFALNTIPALTTRPDQIKQLRQTILNLAVRGKLVPQDQNDEPAEAIVKRIKKIKKYSEANARQRRNDETSSVEFMSPFPLPSAWTWTNLGTSSLEMRYGTSKKCSYEKVGTPVLRIPNVSGGQIDISDLKYGPLTASEIKDLSLQRGDLLVIRSNGSLDIVGRAAEVDESAEGMSFAGYLVRIRLFLDGFCPRYVWLAMNTDHIRDQIEKPIRSTVGLKNVNSTELSALSFPLPPLAEQHRIVAKVDALMKTCDQLEASLDHTAATRLHLLDALLTEALLPAEMRELEAAE